MTINSETRVAGPFEGNDSTVAFPFTFKVFDSDELYVVRATDSVETVLELATDFTVALNPDQNASPGGTVTLPAPLATGSTLTLTSDLEALQPLDLTNQGGFYPRVINNAFDRVTILIQQLKSVVSRTLKFPLSDGPVGDLPGRAARAGAVLAFDNATGEPIVGPNIADVGTVGDAIAAIHTVADNIGDVNTVADNLADVTNFADVYYGPSETDPTLRQDGTPLEVGDLYFNTTTGRLRIYDGSAWRETVGGSVVVQNFSGDGVETNFLLNYAPGTEIVTNVFIAGIYQQKNTYEIGGLGGDVLIFSQAPPAGTDNIEVVVSSVVPSDGLLRLELASLTNAAFGSSLVGYLRSEAGAVGRMLSAKLADEVHVNDFGADPTGVADSTAAIMAAWASMGGVIGKLKFGKGVYRYTELNFDSAVGLHLEGHGAIGNTVLRCTSTNAAHGIKFRSTFDCTASFITFDHSSASFTGYLADMRHKPASGTDTQGMYFFRCTFASQGYDKYSAKGVCLDQATLCTFEGCKFVSLLRPVDGQNAAGGSYSNGMRFKNCQFADNVGYNFNFLGEQWSIHDCNFQASHGGAQLICFSDNATTWRGLSFINCGVYDATALGASMLNLGTGSGLTVENGMWGGRGDLGSTTWLNATGAVVGVNVTGTTFSMFTNIAVAGVAGCYGWNISGGNIFIPITAQPITATNMLINPANALGARFDNNAPNVSLRSGTGPTSNWRTYNPDGTMWIGGQIASVGAGAVGTLIYPLGACSATLHVNLGLKSPATTSNVVSEVGNATGSGFQYYVNGTGASTVTWSALVLP